jgi:hypothetical protein
MTDKSTIQKAFNTLFFDFLKDVMTVYPDNKEIKYAHDSFDTLKRMNPPIIIRAWYSFVYMPYSTHINGGDLDFFLNKDYKEDIGYEGTEEFLVMIDKVRNPLRALDDKNKEHSREYLRKLNKLSEIWGNM